MKLKIQKIYSQGSGKINEDELLIKNNLYAVFDGATSLVGYTDKLGRTGGKLAAGITKQTFSKNSGSLKNLALSANKKIRSAMKIRGIDVNKKEGIWSTCLAAIRFKKDKIEYANIADCLILVIFQDSSYKLLTPYYNQDLSVMIAWKKLADKKTKNIWLHLRGLIVKGRKQAGIKYSSLNGLPNVKKFLMSGKISLKNVRSIILFTDGLILPKKNPKRPDDWSLFAKLYLSGGLKKLLNK